ncbi:MAG: preprotein translocase subunit SecA [Ruminiclostridium sp.]|nr:preprotein translocase subunit SecA [Ruminiclostridium sp.]
MIKEFEKNKAKFIKSVKEAAEGQSAALLNSEARAELNAVKAFAAVFCAVKEGLSLTPYDTQIETGGYLENENIVELATGEGKTIAAVFSAYWSVINGEHVNIFTFNDYLAKRDCKWMKPVYDILGVSTAYINEDTPREMRKEIYRCDVVYSTIKECGFDYLRDFAVFDPEEAVLGKLERAIVDEADSTLIDEARIPLVAAGSYAVKLDEDFPHIFSYVKGLSEDEYEVSLETGSAYLTPKGQKKTEEYFKLNNIFDEENNELLSKIGDCLEALYVLKEDVDYIVKNDGIGIIDKFTGRVSEERHYPSLTHAAVELKHGLKAAERGLIIGNITIQYFIRLFNRFSGMTGTALSAKEEFETLYGLTVKEVKPNTPSVRIDLPMSVYYDKASKLNAAADEVLFAYKKGQPVLVGTADINQSEEFSELLKKRDIPHTVLNAKNDELEAEIVKNAGKKGSVTVSTNMTGRGVDIKLGGEDEAEHDEVAEKGGLYVICTFMGESKRINNQLYGRAGRQGDPGKSKLFVSLDEEIMEIYGLKKNVPDRHYPEPTEEELTDKTLLKEVNYIQHISQIKRLNERNRLLEFNFITEAHRKAIFTSREKMLSGENECTIWQDNFSSDYNEAAGRFGEEKINAFQKKAALSVINEHWSEYLDYVASLREGIHLRAIGGKVPGEEFNIESENYYNEMMEMSVEKMGMILAEVLDKGIENTALAVPTRTWTYLLADIADELKRRTLFEFLFGTEEEEADPYSDEYDKLYSEEEAYEEDEEYAEAPEEPEEPDEKQEKKGFFARLFGKK